jgi:hypothetical protein
MDVFELHFHSCKFCQEIKIDGTLNSDGWVKQSFTWTLPEVQAFAEECMLFKWILQLTANLKATDQFTLCISTNHEDLKYFEAEWKDANGMSVPLTASEQSRLHIFAESSMFP